jgi:hypothetical protein
MRPFLDNDGGMAVARWVATGETVILGSNPGGLGSAILRYVCISSPLGVTVAPGDHGTWKRLDLLDVDAYADLLDANTGATNSRITTSCWTDRIWPTLPFRRCAQTRRRGV